MIQIIHTDELAEVLELNGQHKLDLKVDNSGNVTFTKSATGLKGDVTIPPAAVAFNGVTRNDLTLTFTKTDGSSPMTVDLPAFPVDVKLQGLEFTDTGKLKATLSDSSTTEVDFNAKVVVAALVNAGTQEQAQLKTFLLNLLKGEEVQNAAGNQKGFLLASA